MMMVIMIAVVHDDIVVMVAIVLMIVGDQHSNIYAAGLKSICWARETLGRASVSL